MDSGMQVHVTNLWLFLDHILHSVDVAVLDLAKAFEAPGSFCSPHEMKFIESD